MSRLRGIVMCGGQSKRMGTDKGLIPINETCWAGYVADKLKGVGLPISISINPSQTEKYQQTFFTDELVIDDQQIDGPLNGLFSAHAKYPDDDLLLLACDMIDMQADTIQKLIDAYVYTNGAYDYYVYQNQDRAEPFCGIYKAQILQVLSRDTAQFSGWGFQRLIKSGEAFYLPVIDQSHFNNYNSTKAILL